MQPGISNALRSLSAIEQAYKFTNLLPAGCYFCANVAELTDVAKTRAGATIATRYRRNTCVHFPDFLRCTGGRRERLPVTLQFRFDWILGRPHGITATPTVSVLGFNGSAGNRTRGVVGPTSTGMAGRGTAAQRWRRTPQLCAHT